MPYNMTLTDLLAVTGAIPVQQRLKVVRLGVQESIDREFGGNFCIYGAVSGEETSGRIPLKRRVRLHRSRDGMLVRETWSKADGSYEFTEISGRYEYDVIAWDHELQFRSVVANNLTPEAM